MLARIHFMVRTTPGQMPAIDRKELEAELAAAARRWDDDLRDALIEAEGEAAASALYKRWGAAFPLAYRERVPARARRARRRASSRPLDGRRSRSALALYRPLGAAAGALGFKVYRRRRAGRAVRQPADARAHGRARARRGQLATASTPARRRSALHDFELQAQVDRRDRPEALARLFEDAFARVFRGEVENDDFNRLVLLRGLSAPTRSSCCAPTRSTCKQIGFAQSQATIAATLAAHPRIARMLVALFQLRFDPETHDEAGRRGAGQRASSRRWRR